MVFCGKSGHEATFVEMLLKPSATRGGKSSGVEEICAQGWVREGEELLGDMITLWPKDRGQDMVPFPCLGRRRRWSFDEQQVMSGFRESLVNLTVLGCSGFTCLGEGL